VAPAVRAEFQLVAQWGSTGTGNGQFRVPQGIAVDSAGNVYVADRDNNRIQKFTSDGTFILAFTGPPNPDPNHFNGPSHLALDPQGNLLVSNEGGYRIEKFSPSGAYLATYGDLATFRDNPRGVAADSAGNVYVALPNAKQIDKFAPGGGLLTSWTTAVATHQNPDLPTAVAVSPADIVYVNDFNNGTIDEFTTDGRFVKEWSTQAFAPAQRGTPDSVALDSQGNFVVGDARQGAIEKFSADGAFISSTRSTGEQPGEFHPQGVAVGPGDDIFVTDFQSRVLRFRQAAGPTGKANGTPTGTVLLNGRPFTGGPIPYGSKLDVTHGTLLLTTDTGTVLVYGNGVFAAFVLLRGTDNGKPIVELRLTGGSFAGCARKLSVASKAKPKIIRQLWAKAKGRFRTRGRYASATVRGTVWLTVDRCDGTLTRVTQGTVQVSDFILKKKLLVHAGASHLAQKP